MSRARVSQTAALRPASQIAEPAATDGVRASWAMPRAIICA
jgi:hypothetical protein